MRIRLQDVATLAGVSEATVSRVINAKPGVSDSTRDRVVRVLAELGYEPPSLRSTPRVGSIGLMVPELDNPIFPAFAQEIEARLLAAGYLSHLCCASRAGATEDDYIDTLLDRGAAGIMVVSGRNADTIGEHRPYAALAERGLPLVFVNGWVPGLGVPTVSTDDAAALVAAYEHLAALGHERIGFVTGPMRYQPVLRKLDAFRRVAAAAGHDEHTIEALVAESMFTLEGGHAGAFRVFDEGATAVIAASDMMALGAIRAARQRGFDVPTDVSVVGFDDTPLMRFTDPPLTTVRQPVESIAGTATGLLLAQIARQRVERGEILVAGELIARSSTARPVRTALVGTTGV